MLESRAEAKKNPAQMVVTMLHPGSEHGASSSGGDHHRKEALRRARSGQCRIGSNERDAKTLPDGSVISSRQPCQEAPTWMASLRMSSMASRA